MNLCRHRTLISFLLTGAIGFVFLYGASSVEARAIGATSQVPSRFFAEISIPPFMYPALQAAAPASTPPAPAAPASAQPPAILPDGKGKDVTQRLCSNCHEITKWTDQHHTEDEWGSIIDNMIDRGLIATDDEITITTTYLTKNFGPKKHNPQDAPPNPPVAPAPPPPTQP